MQLTKTEWAERVEQALAAQGHNARWLAQEIDKHPATLSRMMHGHPDYLITSEIQARIVKALRVPHPWLFGEDES